MQGATCALSQSPRCEITIFLILLIVELRSLTRSPAKVTWLVNGGARI